MAIQTLPGSILIIEGPAWKPDLGFRVYLEVHVQLYMGFISRVTIRISHIRGLVDPLLLRMNLQEGFKKSFKGPKP